MQYHRHAGKFTNCSYVSASYFSFGNEVQLAFNIQVPVRDQLIAETIARMCPDGGERSAKP